VAMAESGPERYSERGDRCRAGEGRTTAADGQTKRYYAAVDVAGARGIAWAVARRRGRRRRGWYRSRAERHRRRRARHPPPTYRWR